MEAFIISVIVVLILAVILLVVFKLKKENNTGFITKENKKPKAEETMTVKPESKSLIKVERLSPTVKIDESNLMEIKDSVVLGKINNAIPEIGQIANSFNNVENVLKETDEILYRAIIPAGEKLADSNDLEGAVRGFYKGQKGIKGHANLIPVEPDANKGLAIASNTVNAAISVTSMIVGQYYMSQIDKKLKRIDSGIAEIKTFQENEFRSSVKALAFSVRNIIISSEIILKNDSLRERKLIKLDDYRDECLKLLEQVNLEIKNHIEVKERKFNKYVENSANINEWCNYQKILLEVLNEITELIYEFNMGKVTRSDCNALFNKYKLDTLDTYKSLVEWHDEHIEKFNIEDDFSRRKRDDIFHNAVGHINKKYQYKEIPEEVSFMLETQNTNEIFENQDQEDLYNKDVELIIKGDKVYYLPEIDNKNENSETSNDNIEQA